MINHALFCKINKNHSTKEIIAIKKFLSSPRAFTFLKDCKGTHANHEAKIKASHFTCGMPLLLYGICLFFRKIKVAL